MTRRQSPSAISPWLSAPRITVLVASFLVALGSGTNYIYSAYSPQLGTRLNISYTQLNIVGLAGNAGVYCSAPVWGRVVDSRGPRILLVISFVLFMGGYSGIKYLYDSGLPPNTSTLPTPSFYFLVLCNFLTGSASLAGLTSAINSTIKSFPDAARASTTGLVVAGFGLSAFFFTTLANTLFSSTTSTFLLILKLGTSCLMALGFFFVRPIPLLDQSNSQPLEDGREALLPDDHYSSTSLLIDAEHSNVVVGSIQTSGQKSNTLNVYGKALWCNLDFWLLFAIYSLLAGTGYTYINNVGTMSQSLYAHNNRQYNEAQALRWQATQVSVISLTNFGGRILIGLFSDFAKNLYKMPRSHSLALVSFLYLISQVAAAVISDISNLWIASALLGLAHGSISALLPIVCLEWFGLPHFSENWGYLCISPAFSANLLSYLFGRSLDAHGNKTLKDLLPHAYPRCSQGLDCYLDAVYLTISATFLSLLLSFWTGYRDIQKAAKDGEIVEEER